MGHCHGFEGSIEAVPAVGPAPVVDAPAGLRREMQFGTFGSFLRARSGDICLKSREG
jgi:hypothetical protein